MLKTLILCHLPRSQHLDALNERFEGKGHSVESLREHLSRAGGRPFPAEINWDLALISTWSPELRYTPGVGSRNEAVGFLESVKRIVEFMKQRAS
jgi:hypothetical protein